MDVGSLNISKISDNNSQNNDYMTKYVDVNRSLENNISEEKVKTNDTQLDNKTNLKSNANVNGGSDNAEASKEEDKFNFEDFKKAIKAANEKLRETSRYLSYSIHEKTNQLLISLKDADGNVIKEIPTRESADFYAKLMEVSGILLDEKR